MRKFQFSLRSMFLATVCASAVAFVVAPMVRVEHTIGVPNKTLCLGPVGLTAQPVEGGRELLVTYSYRRKPGEVGGWGGQGMRAYETTEVARCWVP